MGTERSYRTLANNTIKYMLKFVDEYELVQAKKHPKYKGMREFFKAKDMSFQNFYKFYGRFIACGRNPEALLPLRRGPKPKYQETPLADDSLVKKILDYRKSGFNRYLIAEVLKKESITPVVSPSTVYRILRKYGVSKLTPAFQEEKRKIIRTHAGSLAHIDLHYLPKGIVTAYPHKRYYALGVIDDFSRIAWVEIIESVKAVDATFGMFDILMILYQRYNIKFSEALTDNGVEFCGKLNHPFEKLFDYFSIKHRRTKPYRPQTNGKIERFWKTFHDEVIEGSVFDSLDQLKDAVLGYNFYYNEHRPHQALNGKIPLSLLQSSSSSFKDKTM